jgi:hypothetical protein
VNGRFGLALRTLAGPWLVVPLAILEIANLTQLGAPWRGEALWTADWMAIVLFVVGPLAAGFAAVDASRLTRPGAIHLVIVSARPQLAFVRAAAWCALPLVAVHTVALVTALVVGGGPLGDVLRVDLLLGFGVQCLALVWWVALGSAIGRFVPSLLSGLIGAASGLLLFYLLSAGGSDDFGVLALGGATISRLGLEWNVGYLLTQAVVLVGTAALFVAVPLALRAGRRMPSPTGAGMLVAALLIVLVPQAMADPGRRNLEATPEPPTLCFEGEPTICFHEQHARFAEPVAMQINDLVDAADQAGYQALVPDRVEEESRGYTPAAGTWSFAPVLEVYRGEPWLTEDLIQSLVAPTHCPQLTDDDGGPPEAYWQNLSSLMRTWSELAGEDYVAFGDERVLSPDEVAAVMDAFGRCELEAAW